jgi:hypothetical protein
MGRAKILMSHTRNIRMEMASKFYRYAIPLYGEKPNLGNLISAEVKDNEIVLIYENKGVEPKIKHPEPNFVIDFN